MRRHGGLGGGGDDFTQPAKGGRGAYVAQCYVTMYDCQVFGGSGFNALDGGHGGDACHTSVSTWMTSRCTFRGGSGGSGSLQTISDGGDAGNGILAASCTFRSLSLSVSAGQPGCGGGIFSCGMPGFATIGGPFIDLGPTARSAVVDNNPAREGTSVRVTLTGLAGDRVGLFVTPLATPSAFNPFLSGQQVFQLGAPTTLFSAGTVPASGILLIDVPLGDLGVGVQAKTLVLQPATSGASGRRVLATPIPLLVLDSAF